MGRQPRRDSHEAGCCVSALQIFLVLVSCEEAVRCVQLSVCTGVGTVTECASARSAHCSPTQSESQSSRMFKAMAAAALPAYYSDTEFGQPGTEKVMAAILQMGAAATEVRCAKGRRAVAHFLYQTSMFETCALSLPVNCAPLLGSFGLFWSAGCNGYRQAGDALLCRVEVPIESGGSFCDVYTHHVMLNPHLGTLKGCTLSFA